jgi:hypothetical protein
MANWTKIAQTMAEGDFGDDWRKARAEEQAIKSEQLRNTLAQNADTRAAAGEARTQEGYEYGKTRRGHAESMDAAALVAAGLSNEQAQAAIRAQKAKEDVFNLSGGAQGEANETIAERKRRASADQREGQRLGLDQQRLGIEKENAALGRKRTQQEMDFEAQIQPHRLTQAENVADPRTKYASDINALSSIYNAAVRSGDDETAAAIKERINSAIAQQEAETLAWNERRGNRRKPPSQAAAPPAKKEEPKPASAPPQEQKPFKRIR